MEIADNAQYGTVTDTKNRDAGSLVFTRDALAAFVSTVAR